jgi:hypothetical protein
MTYVVIANIAIGTVLSAIAIRYLLKAQFVKPEQLRLNKPRLRTAASIIASAAGGGLALFMLQNPRTTEPVVAHVFCSSIYWFLTDITNLQIVVA